MAQKNWSQTAETFTVRDLRERTGQLIRDAEDGRLSVITKHGKPVFIAVPFDEAVVRAELPVTLAVKLFQDEVLSVGKAARFAGCSTAEFIDHLEDQGINAVHYDPEELDRELMAIG